MTIFAKQVERLYKLEWKKRNKWEELPRPWTQDSKKNKNKRKIRRNKK